MPTPEVLTDLTAGGTARRGRTLVLLRHGRTAWNHEGRAQGHADVGLDEVGHAQAEAVAPVLASLKPVVLWTSDLARAHETASYVVRSTGLDAARDPRLREYALGDRTGLTVPEFAERFPDEYAVWSGPAGRVDVAGGESHEQVRDRTAAALTEIADGLADGETGLVVMHGACLKTAVVTLLGWPLELRSSLQGMDNCAWSTLVQSGPDEPWQLAGWNQRLISVG